MTIISLAERLQPDWTIGDPLPDNLTDADFERLIRGAHTARLRKDDTWYHYKNDDVGQAALGQPGGQNHLEIVLSRNKKHKEGACEHKCCAEPAAEAEAKRREIKRFAHVANISEQLIDNATGINWDRRVPCGQCRNRYWDLEGVYGEDTMWYLGLPYYRNTKVLLMGWRFGRLIKHLGPYEGYWHS